MYTSRLQEVIITRKTADSSKFRIQITCLLNITGTKVAYVTNNYSFGAAM